MPNSHTSLPSRRLRQKDALRRDAGGLDAAYDAGFHDGRAAAAGDVALLAATFEKGYVWVTEAVSAALGDFDSRTLDGGFAHWVENLPTDTQATLAAARSEAQASLDALHATVREVVLSPSWRILSETAASVYHTSRKAFMDEAVKTDTWAAAASEEDSEDRT